VRSRIPLAYAGLLVIALVAVLGFAAFGTGSPWNTPTTEAETPAALSTSEPISARVASAVLALAVSPQPDATQAPTVEVEGAAPTASPPAVAEIETSAETTAPATSSSAVPTTSTTASTPRDTTPPRLEVDSPRDGDTVSDRVVTFRGHTEPGADVFSGPFAAEVTEDGDWEVLLVLSVGDNGAIITARDAAGNETEVRLVVTYEPETTTTKPPATTTTSGGSGSPTTTAAPAPEYSPLWPPDSPGRRNVEEWRDEVAAYWPAERVDCALGLIVRESNGDPSAYNSRTAVAGLFQHRVPYWAGRASAAGFVDGDGLVASPFHGEANIAAAAYLANYYDSRSFWAVPWGFYAEEDLPSYGSCGS
jgi:hypothetical protein